MLQLSSITVTEGAEPEASFAVTLSAESGFEVAVDFGPANGRAQADFDHQSVWGPLSFPAGTVTQTAAAPIVDDVLDEDTETFLLTLVNAVYAVLPAGPGGGTILDDDPPPTVSVGDAAVAEGDSGTVSAVFRLALSGASGREIRVSYQTADGTATAGEDYLTASSTAVLPPGREGSEVTVAVRGDLLDEPDETFRVLLTTPVNVVVGDGEGLGTILDDDEPPTVDIGDVGVTEGDDGLTDGTFTLTCRRGAVSTSRSATPPSTAAPRRRPTTWPAPAPRRFRPET